MASGNLTGLKKVFIERLDALREFELDRTEFASFELLCEMARLTGECGREIAVYIARDGEILDVFVGTGEEIMLPPRRAKRSEKGLSGIRCIHTHPEASSRLSDKDLYSLRDLWLDAMAALSVRGGEPKSVTIALIDGKDSARELEPIIPQRISRPMWMSEIEDAEQRVKEFTRSDDIEDERERVLLVGIDTGKGAPISDSLDELERLVDTAGGMTVARVDQKRDAPDNVYYIGSGKLDDIREACRANRIDTVVFNDELSAVQLRNLEEGLNLRVIDRTTLILDIFAQRASSSEGKLQVELAQQKYRLPRLTGMGVVLSRLGGGIGTRGPGEKQLEVNRRYIRRRITDLERELEQVKKQRAVRRVRREKNSVPVVALVGYTNAGKSTLLNTLSGSDVLAEDKLFATLDAVSRRVELPCGTVALFVDTVGFIEKLPTDLVNAFRATLEEAKYADLLVHVIDASNPSWPRQRDVVNNVLTELEATDKPIIQAFNKTDALPKDEADALGGEGVEISAEKGDGLDALLAEIEKLLGKKTLSRTLMLPYDMGSLRSRLHDIASSIDEDYLPEGVLMRITVSEDEWNRVSQEASKFETDTASE